MLGNSLEWCYRHYEANPQSSDETYDDHAIANEVSVSVNRIQRGGSFYLDAAFQRSAYRHLFYPTGRSTSNGFRPVRTMPR